MTATQYRRSLLLLAALGLSLGAQAAPPAQPEPAPGETLTPFVYGGTTYDSNLFRVSGDDEAQARLGTTDTSELIHRLGAGLLVEVPVSLQTLRFEGWAERAFYQEFDTLNHTAADALAAWDWEIGQRWSGTIDAGYSRGIARFEELQRIQKDVKTGRRASVDAGYRFLPDWEAVVGASWRDTEHEERDFLDRSETTTFAELLYHSPVDTRVGLRAERTDGNLEQGEQLPDGSVISNDFEQTTYSAVVGWQGTSKSYLEGRLGYTVREYEDQSERDFEGVTSRLTYLWQASVKTAFRLSAWRELQSLDSEIATYVLSRGVSLEPIWQATPKTRVRGLLAYRKNDFEGAEGTASENAGREDEITAFGLGVDYAVLRNLNLFLETEVGERNSNQEQNDYQYEQVFAGVSYAF